MSEAGEALVVLRAEGLYCPAGDFYIDPRRPVVRAVITHAHGDHARSGCQRYWAAAEGLGLMQVRLGRHAAIESLPYGQVFTLGRALVSLHPAGHILGSAQVRIEVDGAVWVVSGDYKRDPDPSCTPFQSLPCDVFITEATFASPHYRWTDSRIVAREILNWWRGCKASGEAAVLFCYALGKAQRILAELRLLADQEPTLAAETVYLHNAMLALVKVYSQAGIRMLATAPVVNQPRDFDWCGKLVLAPPGAAGTPWMKRFARAANLKNSRGYSSGFASGWMHAQADRGGRVYDHGFALSDHADWDSLLRTIEETGARRVRVMHGNGDVLIETLRARGIDAAVLGVPVVETAATTA